MVRFQVRKRGRLWEVWVFQGRSWRLLESFHSFNWAMILATGQDPYGDLPQWKRKLKLVLEWA